MKKFIYAFGNDSTEGCIEMRDLLGSKGANLAEMCLLGLPVPSGFTISTEVCNEYYSNNRTLPVDIRTAIKQAISTLEQNNKLKFGDTKTPLFISVRSGSRSSMPGMMDSILNIGMNDDTIQLIPDQRFACDSYRRLIQMYGNVVLHIESRLFEAVISDVKHIRGIRHDSELNVEELSEIIQRFQGVIALNSDKTFPQDVHTQLYNAIIAVFASWMNERAVSYRKIHNISEKWGTAVNVQTMVFGNLNNDSGSGVAFTRNPSNGLKELFGEYLVNAQGEDIVSGVRTPKTITGNMHQDFPDAYTQLIKIQHQLENHYRDMQDIEFTVQDKKLWILQTRNAKRAAKSAIKVVVDMVDEGLISRTEAIMRVDFSVIERLMHPTLDEKADYQVIARGLPAAPGAVSGIVVFSTAEAIQQANSGQQVILVRNETSPEDINGMNSAVGILTTCGGMTSHAAVVSRGMGKVCICGTEGIVIDYKNKIFTAQNNCILKSGDVITLDGNSGKVIAGKATTVNIPLSDQFHRFMRWVNEHANIQVRTNADTIPDIVHAKLFNVDGIGLCRSEHMFFGSNRINLMRKMIIADTFTVRMDALKELEEIQKQDFIGIFREIGDLPVTIRLLDPPLHEFLPIDEASIQSLADNINLPYTFISKRIFQLKETNPMLGHRGCRLGISYPEIYEMQVRAIFAAATSLPNYDNMKLEIMVPFVMNVQEFKIIKSLIQNIGKQYSIKYSVGNMVELPSAALTADKIAQDSEFFSFGTNDLTQMTLGLSRDDASTFINSYCEEQILPIDPFVSLYQDSVGELMKIAIRLGKKVNPRLKLGICGEHGGDPDTVQFCIKLGLDYVSCSPYRIPVARLAAAQYSISTRNEAI